MRWTLASVEDRYQVALRHQRLRAQGELTGMTGWMEVLDGRLTALQAEFPLSGLSLQGAIPGKVMSILALNSKVSFHTAELTSPRAGVYEGEGKLQLGLTSIPARIEVENISLPSGSSAYLTARVALSVSPRDLPLLSSERGFAALANSTDGAGLVHGESRAATFRNGPGLNNQILHKGFAPKAEGAGEELLVLANAAYRCAIHSLFRSFARPLRQIGIRFWQKQKL